MAYQVAVKGKRRLTSESNYQHLKAPQCEDFLLPGTAAASLSTVKSRDCTVGEAAYRFIGRVPAVPFVDMFRTVFWGCSGHTLLSTLISFTCFSDSLSAFGGVTWVNPCNVLNVLKTRG